MTDFSFDREDVLRCAAAVGIELDEEQVDAVTRQMRGALAALAAFDLRVHKWSEPALTYDARWKQP